MPLLGNILSDTNISNSTGVSSIDAFRKTSDQGTSSTSYADVTGFSASVAASEIVVFNYTIYYTSGALFGIGLAMNGPASPANIVYGVEIFSGVASINTNVYSGYDTGLVLSLGATSPLVARVSGAFENGSNAGTLALRFKSSSALNTATILRGSNGFMMRI